MLKIINDLGQILELYEDTSIPVERNNALFSASDKFIQDITYPGKAGLTPSNKQFIKSGHLVESSMDVYELNCSVVNTGLPFYAGVFTYKIVKDQIEFIVKVNFGTIAHLVKTTMLNQIYTLDAPAPFNSKLDLENLMKATCEHPDDYPMVYFPVFNPNWSPVTGGLKLPLINNWDISLGKFDTYPTPFNSTIEVPFYKLSYVFIKTFQALGFDAEGGYFKEEVSKNIHLFTRAGSQSSNISPLAYHLPEILVTDFLKKITDRLKYIFEFDLLKRKVYIETPQSILKSKEYNDITEYVTAVIELSVSEKKGYRVTLKVDDSDPAMNSGTPDDPVYRPLYELIVGDGGNAVELDVSTLKSGAGSGYIYPACGQVFKTPFSPSELTTWQLKLLKYNGMKPLPGGKFWPEAVPVELDESDALWYRFLNDSKTIKIEAIIPGTMLSNMKATQKVRFKTKEGTVIYALPEKISYNLINNTSGRIKVTIIARTISNSFKTTSVIKKIDDPFEKFGTIRYKAFFNPELHGINEVKAVRVAVIGSGTFDSTPVTVPTDRNGMGGDVGLLYPTNNNTDPIANSELRVYNLSPKYLVYGGRKYNFNTGSGYKYVQLDQQIYCDNAPVWIVF